MTRTQPNKGIPRHRERGIRMSEFKVIEIKKNILEDNDREADVLRSELKADRTFLLNLMSSPGSGKTTTLVRTIGALKDEMRIGVMEADIASDVDAEHHAAAAPALGDRAARRRRAKPSDRGEGAEGGRKLPLQPAVRTSPTPGGRPHESHHINGRREQKKSRQRQQNTLRLPTQNAKGRARWSGCLHMQTLVCTLESKRNERAL